MTRPINPENVRYRQLSAQAAHECGLRQREWASVGQALLALVMAPVCLLGLVAALLAERER